MWCSKRKERTAWPKDVFEFWIKLVAHWLQDDELESESEWQEEEFTEMQFMKMEGNLLNL